MNFRQNFEGVEASVVVVEVGGGNDFVGLGDVDKFAEGAFDGFGGADCGNGERHGGAGFFLRRPEGVDVVDGWRDLAGSAAAKIGEGLLDGGEVVAGFGIGVGGDDVDAKHGVGLGEIFGRAERGAVELQRLHHVGGSKVRCECKRKAEHSGELRAEETGA